MKGIRGMLPHAAILCANMYYVFYGIDRVNRQMNFIDNGLTRAVLAAMCLCAALRFPTLRDAHRWVRGDAGGQCRRTGADADARRICQGVAAGDVHRVAAGRGSRLRDRPRGNPRGAGEPLVAAAERSARQGCVIEAAARPPSALSAWRKAVFCVGDPQPVKGGLHDIAGQAPHAAEKADDFCDEGGKVRTGRVRSARL